MHNQFINYCLDFYGEGGIYPHKFSRQEIEKGLELRLKNKSVSFEADSLDREKVRDIVFQLRGEI